MSVTDWQRGIITGSARHPDHPAQSRDLAGAHTSEFVNHFCQRFICKQEVN
jgi:hypothetical protein